MAKIPFKVSARAARLIGRENVATSQGAITELVKNAYDADATACVILFLPNNDFESRENPLDLWIIDNGHGMTPATIEDHWMVIGTDAKEVKDKSEGGRVVTGAKGIGRFALDRLGRECELYSSTDDNSSVAHWIVDWGEFEGKGKIINDVEATLNVTDSKLSQVYEQNNLIPLLPKVTPSRGGEGVPVQFLCGTAIKISFLHDLWDSRDSLKLRQTLEALLPPKDRGDFNIYIYDHRDIKNSGWIDNFPPDQFDYKLEAKILNDGKINIKIERQEIDVPKISPTFFSLDAIKSAPYTPEVFEQGSYEYQTSIKEILKISDADSLEQYLAIGPFDFNLYFFKLARPSQDTLERYPQKNFDPTARKRWLASSGGIRLYRDGFRVRPYGEPNTQASDWLLLGERVAANPAPVKRIGWRVPPQQLAGTINITKIHNPLLADQSNREGIINDRAFAIFRKIMIGLISEFEYDRSYIYHHFDQAFSLNNPEEIDIEEGKKIADTVLAAEKVEKQPSLFSRTDESDSNLTKLAKAFRSEERKNDALRDDIQVMRGMATLGTVLVSFTHELKQIKANMDSRHIRLENSIRNVVDEKRLELLPKQVNPFDILDRLQREDEKVSRWVDFALSAVSPIKRRRRVINVAEYLQSLLEHWEEFLKSKNVNFHITGTTDNSINLLAHEIDLDSIFYNLIINSIEAFIQPVHTVSRDIFIEVFPSGHNVEIVYKDNGPGLSSKINTIDDIFLFGTSHKAVNSLFDINGTGIGMWLVKTILDEYKGLIEVTSKIGEKNFSLVMYLPIHKE